ncbi:hypothetical protein PCANC_22180 [Puccinia coronata f. sp. avenae]|uniref:Secreted protein n=1 Tax=Puccinia coronata f. sp. avenae TaxID=200324 RepID=A0A2N5TV21_9BASI|nr:hypothetical protein PCANC_22180 [Puccinia coronata f. sp. avenae]PLW40063.1 hypothetical protein PCASD_11755 [Puccinia coronata f. sp. avenae]
MRSGLILCLTLSLLAFNAPNLSSGSCLKTRSGAPAVQDSNSTPHVRRNLCKWLHKGDKKKKDPKGSYGGESDPKDPSSGYGRKSQKGDDGDDPWDGEGDGDDDDGSDDDPWGKKSAGSSGGQGGSSSKGKGGATGSEDPSSGGYGKQ